MSDNLEFGVDSADVEWPETAVALQGEVDRLRAENARLRAEVDAQQAQARHAARRLVEVTADRDRLLAEKRNLMARNRLLRERTDLPLEYSEAHDRLVAERDRLLGIIADFASCGCWNPCTDDTDPDDLELIREALNRKDNE